MFGDWGLDGSILGVAVGGYGHEMIPGERNPEREEQESPYHETINGHIHRLTPVDRSMERSMNGWSSSPLVAQLACLSCGIVVGYS